MEAPSEEPLTAQLEATEQAEQTPAVGASPSARDAQGTLAIIMLCVRTSRRPTIY